MLVTGRDRLRGQQREAVGPEALVGARQERQRRRAPLGVAQAASGSGRSSAPARGRDARRSTPAPRRPGVVRLIARVERSPHSSAEAKASTTASTRASLSAALAAELKEVPAGLIGRRAAGAEVDPHHPLVRDLGEVGLDPLQAVAVGVEEEAAVTRPDDVGELRDRRLGLAVARAAGDVGEEGVGGPGRRRFARPTLWSPGRAGSGRPGPSRRPAGRAAARAAPPSAGRSRSPQWTVGGFRKPDSSRAVRIVLRAGRKRPVAKRRSKLPRRSGRSEPRKARPGIGRPEARR